MSLSDGGMARKQSLKDQVSRYKILANVNKNLEFRYLDAFTKGALDDISDKYLELHDSAGVAMFELNKLKKWKW